MLLLEKMQLIPHPLKQTHYRIGGAVSQNSSFISKSLDTSRRVSMHCSIPSNHPITYQRYEKGNRHTARSIRNIPHDYWSNRTTHYRHDKQRRSKLGLCTRIPQCQREDSRKHDVLSQIQGEESNISVIYIMPCSAEI